MLHFYAQPIRTTSIHPSIHPYSLFLFVSLTHTSDHHLHQHAFFLSTNELRKVFFARKKLLMDDHLFLQVGAAALPRHFLKSAEKFCSNRRCTFLSFHLIGILLILPTSRSYFRTFSETGNLTQVKPTFGTHGFDGINKF